MSDEKAYSDLQLAARFHPGDDPRRNTHGRVRKEVLAAREALLELLPGAIDVFKALLVDDDARLRLAAACEIRDTVMGKPKTADVEIDATVRAELAVVFARLREKVAPEVYAQMLKSVADESK